jgi:hypothetical protein
MSAWSESTPGEVHVTFSGHRTACDLLVIENKPKYASKPKDVTCHFCGGYLTFDVEAARKAAVDHLRSNPAASEWEPVTVYEIGALVAEGVAGAAWQVKRDHGRWNQNHVFSTFMATCGQMAEHTVEARLTGTTALAVLEALTETH